MKTMDERLVEIKTAVMKTIDAASNEEKFLPELWDMITIIEFIRQARKRGTDGEIT